MSELAVPGSWGGECWGGAGRGRVVARDAEDARSKRGRAGGATQRSARAAAGSLLRK